MDIECDDKSNTIILSGKDAERFIRYIFNPTKDEEEQRRQVDEEMMKNVHIIETYNGFNVEVDDLDLSYLFENK